VLRQENGHGANIYQNFLNKNKSWSPSSLNKLLTKTDQSGTMDCKPGSGRKSKTWIAQNVDSLEELVLSQDKIVTQG